MVDGKCTKDYPKDFHETTVMTEDRYPRYTQRANGGVVTTMVGTWSENKEVYVDNRWIAPYKPGLTQKFNAHINVEVCTSYKD